jgi:DNA-binding transcriptional LysR family regulator
MIQELRTLIAVARHGTFAATGARLGLTQAAVSGHIRRLEEALGFALFERTGRSAILNAAGLRTLARAEEIVARVDSIGHATRDEEWTGSLKVGAIASVQATVLARALVPFHAHFPLCRVHLSPGVSLQLVDRIDAGDLDLAILIRPPFDPPRDLEWRPLIHEDYALLVPAGVEGDDWHAIISNQPFIQYDRSSFGGRQVERFLRKASLRPCEWLEIDDIEAMVAIVERGLGVTIAPLTEMILPLPQGVRAISLEPDLVPREIGILSRRRGLSKVAEMLTHCLLEQADRRS